MRIRVQGGRERRPDLLKEGKGTLQRITSSAKGKVLCKGGTSTLEPL